jgi:ubiquinone/menaquinone biosynthesis C-methylase UbiE
MQKGWQDNKLVDWYNQNLQFEQKQMESYVEPLGLAGSDNFVDFGCGNGMLLAYVAPRVKTAVGIDSSPEQFLQAEERLKELNNVELINAGFLDCNLEGRLFSKASARKSLHHLTDDEKFVFFKKISKYLSPGALFALEDGIFAFEKACLSENQKTLFEEAERYYGNRWEMIREAFTDTIFNEYPADRQTWESAFRSGGFEIVVSEQITCFYGKIVARRVDEHGF